MAKNKVIPDDLPLGLDEIEVKKTFRSPVILDEVLSITYDEFGNEIRQWVVPNYKELAAENGQASDWNLSNMLKAGISPKTPIHTSGGCRLDSLSQLGAFVDAADKILNTPEEEPTESNN